MKLRHTKLCLDCDELFDEVNKNCPCCGGSAWLFISRWLKPLQGSREGASMTIIEIRPNSLYTVSNNFILLDNAGRPICDCGQQSCEHSKWLLKALKETKSCCSALQKA